MNTVQSAECQSQCQTLLARNHRVILLLHGPPVCFARVVIILADDLLKPLLAGDASAPCDAFSKLWWQAREIESFN